MSGDGGPGDGQSLPERFFQAARRVLVKDADRLVFDAADILRIAQDSAMQAEFKEIFRTEVNNPRLADIIIHYLEEFASDLESRATISDIKVDLIDRVGMAVVASVTVAAIGMVVVSGGALRAIAYGRFIAKSSWPGSTRPSTGGSSHGHGQVARHANRS